jgi:hypothetical protein
VAVLAGTGVGVYDSIPAGVANAVRVSRNHEPDPGCEQRLNEAYARFMALTTALRIMTELVI